MNKLEKELLERVTFIYGEENPITKGFQAMCENSDIPDAHLEQIAWYMRCSLTDVIKKREKN